MNVLDKERYHGAALTQLVESSGFGCIRKASRTFGHYEINEARRLLVRHSAAAASPWCFKMRPKDLSPLRADLAAGHDVFLCLVCGSEAICLLTADQLRHVIALEADEAQTIRVYARARTSIHVAGSRGELPGTVPRHAFPGRLFR